MPSNPAHDIVWRLRNGRYDHRYEAADEIERLRADKATAQANLGFVTQRLERLQALIEALAAAHRRVMAADPDVLLYEWGPYDEAIEALLAVATVSTSEQEDDRA